MQFNSFNFYVFLFITFTLYYVPALRRYQVWILSLASFVFYAWSSPILLGLLLFSIFVNSFTSFQIVRSEKLALFWASLGVTVNLLVLAFFKYGPLLAGVIADLINTPPTGSLHALLVLPLPIGISFYTFEGISLVVDTLRQQRKSPGDHDLVSAEFGPHLVRSSLFVAFFPHLAAGPILKARDFYPQINTKFLRDINWDFCFRCLTVGYFLKTVVADNLQDYTFWIAYPYFKEIESFTLLTLLFGYSMQIFADFAGYSLIAIGLAAMFGYALPSNFNFPYISRSVTEFWQRWHISLSTWLRNYLYIPLGGNRKGRVRTYINLFIVMLLGGLWHGAAWSFMVWGCYHGIGLAIERLMKDLRGGAGQPDPEEASHWLWDTGRTLWVFTFVTFGWLLFKLPNFSHVIEFLRAVALNVGEPPDLDRIVPVWIFSLPVIAYHLAHVSGIQEMWRNFRLRARIQSPWPRDLCYGVMMAGILLNHGHSNAFIYFQF